MRIVVGMATTAKRLSYAETAIASLSKQVNDIYLYNNDVEKYDWTDNAKFIGLIHQDEPCYFFSCDDDIIYPPTYIQDTIAKIEEHKCIVCYHGRQLEGLDKDYYKDHKGFRAFGKIEQDTIIDVCGTGVTAFSTRNFNPLTIYRAKDKKMSDLVFSLEAAKQGKKIMVLAHEEDYFQDLEVPRLQTIGFTQMALIAQNERFYGTKSRQSELANEIYKLKYN